MGPLRYFWMFKFLGLKSCGAKRGTFRLLCVFSCLLRAECLICNMALGKCIYLNKIMYGLKKSIHSRSYTKLTEHKNYLLNICHKYGAKRGTLLFGLIAQKVLD